MRSLSRESASQYSFCKSTVVWRVKSTIRLLALQPAIFPSLGRFFLLQGKGKERSRGRILLELPRKIEIVNPTLRCGSGLFLGNPISLLLSHPIVPVVNSDGVGGSTDCTCYLIGSAMIFKLPSFLQLSVSCFISLYVQKLLVWFRFVEYSGFSIM